MRNVADERVAKARRSGGNEMGEVVKRQADAEAMAWAVDEEEMLVFTR